MMKTIHFRAGIYYNSSLVYLESIAVQKKKFCMRRVLVVFTVWKQENKARTKEILVKILANNSPFPPHSGSTLFLVIHVNEFHLIETNTHETLLTYPLFREPWSLFSWIQNLPPPPNTLSLLTLFSPPTLILS